MTYLRLNTALVLSAHLTLVYLIKQYILFSLIQVYWHNKYPNIILKITELVKVIIPCFTQAQSCLDNKTLATVSSLKKAYKFMNFSEEQKLE